MASTELLDSKLTAIADEIRELSGCTDKIGLDAMATMVSEGNAEIALQKQLLEQALVELSGKVDPELYNNGYIAGHDDGYSVGYEDGGEAAIAALPVYNGEVENV